ncbi:MAG: carbohydrate kinase [Roseibium sp.]|nr:carbohydrate kinase [Roseibium sp.]
MILVCGEALFDLFADDPNADPPTFEAHIGGSPFNVAVGLARLDAKAAFFGGISTDMLGQKLVDRLAREGVDTQYVHRSPALTTLSLVQKTAGGQPAYTFYGTGAADRMVTVDDRPQLRTSPNFIHIGSYTALVEPIASALKELVVREKGRCLVSFDPNIRPTVEADMDLWRENTEAIVRMADLVKVSDEDLSLIHPGENPAEIARRWVGYGCSLVVVTRGADGADGFTAHHHVSVPGENVLVQDTVGAGDTFQAALLWRLCEWAVTTRDTLASLDDGALHDLLSGAVSAAAITCARRGADLPKRQEIPAFAATAK